jgi:hypothetical protein
MGKIDWGVPVQNRKKEEKFNTPVCTMAAILKEGAGRKFMFNQAAVDALGLVKYDKDNGMESFVSFGRNPETNELFVIASTTEAEHMRMFRTNKSYSFSDKKTYEWIVNTLGLSTSSENYLHLEAIEGESYFKVSNVTSEEGSQVQEVTSEDNNDDSDTETMETIEVVEEAEETVEEDGQW